MTQPSRIFLDNKEVQPSVLQTLPQDVRYNSNWVFVERSTPKYAFQLSPLTKQAYKEDNKQAKAAKKAAEKQEKIEKKLAIKKQKEIKRLNKKTMRLISSFDDK